PQGRRQHSDPRRHRLHLGARCTFVLPARARLGGAVRRCPKPSRDRRQADRPVNVHPGTLPGALFSAATRFGDRPAISDGETTLGFRALALLVEDAARAFMALGIARGDRVAIWAPNGWAWQVVALGAQLAGGVLVPLNTRF